MARKELWVRALGRGSVWKRALKMGLTVGSLQAAINQGDFWWRGELKSAVIIKTIVSPLVGFTLVLFSAAATWVEEQGGDNDGS